MVTVFRSGGFRIVIFVDDHEPAHVHVYADGEAKIDLAGKSANLIWAVGMTRADIRRAMRIVNENRDALLSRWREIHG